MSWFEELVGFVEESPDQVRSNLEIADGSILRSKVNDATFRVGDLETLSLEELRARTKDTSRRDKDAPLKVQEVVADVRGLHQQPENDGALFQVASQFNLLEMVGPSVTPERGVGIYENDLTQGPACAISCGAATIYRNYLIDLGEGRTGQTADCQIDCLSELGATLRNTEERLWAMRNGYALVTEDGLKEISSAIESAGESDLDLLRGKLKIGILWEADVTNGESSNIVSQAFCSALPVAYSHHRDPDLWAPFARLVLEAAYEATLHGALLNRQRTGSPKVFLTLLGGGAFGNDTEWIISSMERALRLFSDCSLDIQVVSYGHSDPPVRDMVSRL